MDLIERSPSLAEIQTYAAAKSHRAAAQHVAEQPGGDGQGSRRLGPWAALVPDDGYRLSLGEPRAGGERSIELASD
jgi:hypothetical protein